MKLEDLKHLPVAKGPSALPMRLDLPEVPVEIAEIELRRSGCMGTIYAIGIHIPNGKPDEPYLVWTNIVDKKTGKRRNIISTRLSEITTYKSNKIETISNSDQNRT